MGASTERIWMVGMMGSGKSTVGASLAKRLGWAVVDTDSLIEQRAGERISDLWRRDGEPAFRAWEAQVIDEVAQTAGRAVISVGGGAILDPDSRRCMAESGLVVWLRADVVTLIARVGRGETRPLLGDDPEEALARVDATRRGHYEQIADLIIDVDDVAPVQAVDRIVAWAEGALARA